jgi:hypothetical protein
VLLVELMGAFNHSNPQVFGIGMSGEATICCTFRITGKELMKILQKMKVMVYTVII